MEPTRSNHARHAADYRRRHRQAQHDQAHANGEEAVDDQLPEITGVYRGAPELIETQAALDAAVARLKEAGSFAYDTEFIGEMSYRPLVCLIQVATDDFIGLIDPLAPGIDLAGFWALLNDVNIHKIVHAGEQDLEHAWRATDGPCANVLDTQIAAGFIGLSYPASLAKLIGEFTGIKLQKGFTFTDWSARPLSASQLKYAADDVRYLPAIERAIRERLTTLGRIEWAVEECDERCRDSKPGFDPETAWTRVRGGQSLDGRSLNVLKLLVAWRDECAQHADVPARTFLKDEILVDICKSRPKSTEKLQTIRHLPRPVIEHHGAEILGMVEQGLAMPAQKRSEDDIDEPGLTERFRLDGVWSTAQLLCAGQSLDPALVASRQETLDAYRKLERGRDVSGERLFQGWRSTAIGDALKQIANGSFELDAKWTNGSLRASGSQAEVPS
jgi:ribonuclease D